MLKLGSTGDKVKELQQKLIARGYSCGAAGADGDFGQGTYNAVIKFQEALGLMVDGIVGDETWNALTSLTGTTTLRSGDKGAAVKALQEKLISRGYSCGAAGADGDFGQGTYNAVAKFQSDHGLSADGIAGPLTFSALEGSSLTTLLKMGSKGAMVKELQQKLIAKGYSCGATGADGDFGQGTYNAVMKFQSANGLSADGIVGPMTWSALNGAQYNTLLKIGSNGSAVKELQQKLINKGYNVGSTGADGSFGYATYRAVIDFQSANGLSADGIVGPATWGALNNSSPYYDYFDEVLQKGSKGSNVVMLQTMLISLGFSCGGSGADGDFGDGTHNAVCNYQSARKLTVDGIVGPATWAKLKSEVGGGSIRPNGRGVKAFLAAAGYEADRKYKETGNNINKFGAWFGMNGEAWCAMFVSWCANQAGILGSLVPRYSWCESGKNWYASKGRYKTRGSGYVPKPGDVIFFYNKNNTSAPYYHTGIVEYVSGSTVHTIEGNAGAKTDGVYRLTHNINDWRIHGYGLNGGITEEQEDQSKILEAAGKQGLFKDHPVHFPGFSKEAPLAILSLAPRITVSAIVAYEPMIVDGKIYQVADTGLREKALSVAHGCTSAGIGLDFSADDIVATLQSLNVCLTPGDIIRYTFEITNARIIQIKIQYKTKVEKHELYQGIIIRIEKLPNQPVMLPVVRHVPDSGRVELGGDTLIFVIGAVAILAIGHGALAAGGAVVTFIKSIAPVFVGASQALA